MKLPKSDPGYFPPTRELPDSTHDILHSFADFPVYEKANLVDQDFGDIGTDDASLSKLKEFLQEAIELEHATIPLYFAALVSIKPGANTEAAELIRSILIEEMLHFAMASNMLIAIGGTPDIAKRDFVPNFWNG